jgi:hypothetical protein
MLSSFVSTESTSVKSPDNNVEVNFLIADEGQAAYKISYKGQLVIDTSYLGFDFTNMPSLGKNLELVQSSKRSFSEMWEMPWGEQRMVDNTFNELVVTLKELDQPKRTFSLTFRVLMMGLGFDTHFHSRRV